MQRVWEEILMMNEVALGVVKCYLSWAGEAVKEPLWMHEVSRERSGGKGGMNFKKLWGTVE